MSGINGANKTTGSVVQQALEAQKALMARLTASPAASSTAAASTPSKEDQAATMTEARGDKLADAGLSRTTQDNPLPQPSRT